MALPARSLGAIFPIMAMILALSQVLLSLLHQVDGKVSKRAVW
jgi:hypothetical protein